MQTVQIDNVYALPGLYDILYNRKPSYKLSEATAFGAILEDHTLTSKSPITSVLELMSGVNSYHRRFLEQAYYYAPDIKTYRSLDKFAEPADDVVNADPATGNLGGKYDAILAYYCSASSIIDPNHPDGFITRDYTQQVYTNVAAHLNEGGIFILDAAPNGYEDSLNIANRGLEDGEYPIYLGTPLRQWVKARLSVADSDDVRLICYSSNRYDRWSGNNYDTLKDLRIQINDRDAFRIKVSKPFCQRCFSEPEIFDMLRAAGFSDIQPWSCDYSNEQYEVLDLTIDVGDSPVSDISELMPNVFVAIK